MKKFGMFALILVLALAVMGVGYSSWSQSLTVTNNVSTGQVKVEINQAQTNDANSNDPEGTAPGTWALNGSNVLTLTQGTLYTYDIASSTVTAAGSGVTSITITITKAYPGYGGNCGIAIKNTGTIPVTLGYSVGTWSLPTGGSSTDLGMTLLGPAFSNGTYLGVGNYTYGTVQFDPTDNTVQNATGSSQYSVTITVTATQANH